MTKQDQIRADSASCFNEIAAFSNFIITVMCSPQQQPLVQLETDERTATLLPGSFIGRPEPKSLNGFAAGTLRP